MRNVSDLRDSKLGQSHCHCNQMHCQPHPAESFSLSVLDISKMQCEDLQQTSLGSILTAKRCAQTDLHIDNLHISNRSKVILMTQGCTIHSLQGGASGISMQHHSAAFAVVKTLHFGNMKHWLSLSQLQLVTNLQNSEAGFLAGGTDSPQAPAQQVEGCTQQPCC